jgi:hypothetical protein
LYLLWDLRKLTRISSGTTGDPAGIQIYLTPWSTILLEKPIATQLVKKFPTFYEICRFITMLKTACH